MDLEENDQVQLMKSGAFEVNYPYPLFQSPHSYHLGYNNTIMFSV